MLPGAGDGGPFPGHGFLFPSGWRLPVHPQKELGFLGRRIRCIAAIVRAVGQEAMGQLYTSHLAGRSQSLKAGSLAAAGGGAYTRGGRRDYIPDAG